ncbi:MAG: hypothetical protein ACLQMS_02005, partial [Desulfomonilaceae bacterium]
LSLLGAFNILSFHPPRSSAPPACFGVGANSRVILLVLIYAVNYRKRQLELQITDYFVGC